MLALRAVSSDVRVYAIDALSKGAALRLQLIESCLDVTLEAAASISRCFTDGGKVLLFGNGGSAADAQHLAAEFVGGLGRGVECFPAIALTTDSSAITALGNDLGFDEVFARQVRALGRRPDVVVAISTSGRSANVLKGVITARELGLTTIALTGEGGAELAALVDFAIVVPSRETARIQECHIALGHVMCEVGEMLRRVEQ